MRTFSKIFTMIFAMTVAVIVTNAQSQIQFEGLYAEGEGAAGWNADGSGPEPAATGHGGIYYYTSSLDYVNPGSSSGGHLLDNINGFPLFAQALADHGFTPDQVTFTFGLADMGDDIEGVDWFQIGAVNYSNFYPIIIRMYLAGEPMISSVGNYGIYRVGAGIQEMETGFLRVNDVAGQGSEPVKQVAAAFISDMDGEELKADIQVESAANLSGNGRTGGYFDAICTFTKGLPTFPLQGLYADNEGTAAWNADGTGPEPYGNGHGDVVYYSASVDYDGINPDPNACLGHFLEGSTGFLNTLLQLQYRGFEIGDLKMKMGLCSLGPDVEGEDWGINQYGQDWVNEYNQRFTIELYGEPIIEYLLDTNRMTFINSGTVTWSTKSSVGKAYDISENASQEAQFVAQSFLRDLGTHYLVTDVADISYVGQMPSGNGRSGVWYELVEAYVKAVHTRATFVEEGPVSGEWTTENFPYYIEGPVIIEPGDSLIIHPGVRVATRGAFPFTVNGYVNAEGTSEQHILFSASNPNINWDGLDYEGANIISSKPSVYKHCIFQYGRAQSGEEYNSGGAFAVRDFNDLEICDCIFRHNVADIPAVSFVTCGGAIALWNSDPLIQKCVFYDNYALDYAGAMLVYSGSNPVISNCLFYDNESQYGGALAYYEYSNGILINNTIVDNQGLYGGGLYFYMESNPEVINNIIWGNTASASGNQVYSSLNGISNPGFYYCDIEGGQSSFGGSQINGGYVANLEDDPGFTNNPDDPPYLIGEESPCINAGTPDSSAWYFPEYLPQTCLCGNARISNGRIDIGAYERLIGGVGDDIQRESHLAAWPNPFTDQIHIGIGLQETAQITVQLVNGMGCCVNEPVNTLCITGENTISINTRNLPAGLYFVKVLNGDKVRSAKVLKVD